MSESGGKLYGAVNADCLDVMKRMADNSVDAIVTDPPYGISFMSKGFDTFKKEGMTDNQAFQADMTPLFKEMLRIAKPGAHLLAFGGTRTYHRSARLRPQAANWSRVLLPAVHLPERVQSLLAHPAA